MCNRATKRRAIVQKIEDDIARLRKDIADRRAHLEQARARLVSKSIAKAFATGQPNVDGSWFAAWSRHAPVIAAKVAQLERALRRLPVALDKSGIAAMEDRLHRERVARIQSVNAGILRRLESVGTNAPSIDERWARERVQRLSATAGEVPESF